MVPLVGQVRYVNVFMGWVLTSCRFRTRRHTIQQTSQQQSQQQSGANSQFHYTRVSHHGVIPLLPHGVETLFYAAARTEAGLKRLRVENQCLLLAFVPFRLVGSVSSGSVAAYDASRIRTFMATCS